MDEQTFLVNRERAVDYLNSLEKVNIFHRGYSRNDINYNKVKK